MIGPSRPLMSRMSVPGRSDRARSRNSLTLSRNSMVSSLTFGIVENSWRTPSMRTEVTAAPVSELKSTRRRALPIVIPKPGGSGAATIRA